MSDNSDSTATSTDLAFYPSVRQGYRPSTRFTPGEIGVADPSRLSVTLDVTGHGPDGASTTNPSVDLHVYGPGDVIGLDGAQIVRTDPTPGTTDFPPNYFPFVEFDRADLPWLFSPTRADDRGRNRPWCCLVVVDKHADGVDVQRGGTGPLPTLTTPTDELPDLAESWAWAHVQVLGGRPSSAAAERDQFVGRSNKSRSRLLCPRNLRQSRSYVAAVVPTYEPGRLAGLGEDPFPEAEEETDDEASASPPIDPAWTDADGSVRLPVYHLWEFATGPEGDFEQLVRALTPRDLGPDVGYRTIDTSDPGPPSLRRAADDQAATVGMGGALRSADVDPDADPYGVAEAGGESEAAAALRDLVNQPERVFEALGIPAIGPPKYGQWPADRSLVPDPSGDGRALPRWFHELNALPQHRAAAGFGTQVVQDRQEDLAARAWDQFGDLSAANERARVTQLADDTLRRAFAPLAEADLGDLLRFGGPALGFSEGLAGRTILDELGRSGVPPSVTTPAFRRFTRPGGPLARRDGVSFEQGAFVEQFVDVAAPGEVTRPGADSVDALDVDFGATVEERLDPNALVGHRTFETYGRDLEELAALGGVTDGGERPLPGGGPRVPSWRVSPDGEVMSVEEAVTYYETHPDADPGARAVARAVGAARALETSAVDLQRSLAMARAQAATGEEAPVEAGPALAGLDDDALAEAEAAFAALAADPEASAVDPSLSPAAVETAIGEIRRHRERLSGAIDEATTGAVDTATGLRTAEQPLARVVETVRGLGDAIDVGETGATLAGATVAPFEAVDLRAVGAFESSAVPRVAISGFADWEAGAETAVDVRSMRSPLLAALDPTLALRMRLSSVLGIDPEQLATRPEPLAEVLAHPRFYEPMYEPLRDLDQEYLLPGAAAVPKDTVGAVVTNPPFIEAYMAGLNHETSRELRWRRFPTDRRGTYFRHFWDRRGEPGSAGDPDARADVGPMHGWDGNRLGANSPRPSRTDRDEDESALGTVVLLVRGELLDRYPDTHIYAAKAVESEPASGDPDRVPYMPGRPETPIPESYEGRGDLHIYPDFRGTLDPDITFFGFDLTVEEAVNDPYHEPDTPEPGDHNDEGWFFVIEEPPGEMHFGLDEASPGDVGAVPVGITHGAGRETEPVPAGEDVAAVEKGWSGLSWGHLVTEGEPESTRYVPVESGPPAEGDWAVEAGTTYHGSRTWEEADAATWGWNSAHMARITLQQPVRVSVHADDLLPDMNAETDGGHDIGAGTGDGPFSDVDAATETEDDH